MIRANRQPRGFSPHTRGCSACKRNRPLRPVVFPAYAGMFRTRGVSIDVLSGFPRIRGDVPPTGETLFEPEVFSPHTRGCSGLRKYWPGCVPVFPAYAGMFRSNGLSHHPSRSFPRIRGDVPLLCYLGRGQPACFPRIRGDVPARQWGSIQESPFSPHTRGCSYSQYFDQPKPRVFPAYAGMFLKPAT